MTDNKLTTFNEETINQWIDENDGWSFDGKWIRKLTKLIVGNLH